MFIWEYTRALSVICSSQTSDDVLFSCYGLVFARIRCVDTSWQGLNRRVEVGVAKEGDRLTSRCHAFRVVNLLCRWGYHSMERGTEHIVTPTR